MFPAMKRRDLILAAAAGALATRLPAQERLASLDTVRSFDQMRALVVARDGQVIQEEGFGRFRPDSPTNIKSASKSIISALVGIAIDRGLLTGPDQPVATLLADQFPDDPDPRLSRITIGNLLSMQAGLERMSGPNYGQWVSSRNWVRTALAAPFVSEPGGMMLYSTASTHLLSAALTRVAGRSTLALAQDWLAPVGGFRIDGWDRDPQGIYFGGNQMVMSTRSLLAFGEVYRRGGLAEDGTRVIPEGWIAQSWTPRTSSRWTGDGYGFGWFLRTLGGEQVRYGWGYGGQMIYVVPSKGLTIAITSDPDSPSARTGYRDALHALAADIIAG